MWLSLRYGLIKLTENEPLAFRGGRAMHVECTEGRVWLTVEGQAGDFLLAQGESLRIESNGLALIEGLPHGTVRLLRHAPWPIRSVNRLLRALYGRRASGPAPAPPARPSSSQRRVQKNRRHRLTVPHLPRL